jgi:1-deoxyxylulose-5-phosphate synthase
MDYVNLGKTGLKVSRVTLGRMSYGVPPAGPLRPGSHAWALNEEESQPFFKQALDLGINFFDTANTYTVGSSEEIVGRFLKANTKREDTVIATKLFNAMRDDPNAKGLSRKQIFFELDQSLKRLGTDYIDLYQIHRWDYETPIEETMEALHDVVRSGKVARSEPPPCTPGSSPRPSTSPTSTAGLALSPCRTTTTSSTARKSAR